MFIFKRSLWSVYQEKDGALTTSLQFHPHTVLYILRRCLTTRNAFTLCDEINELLKNGMLTLNAKLGDVPDEKLVSRLVEGWSFFFGTVLPYFEGVFLPLQIELKTYHAKNMSRKVQVASSAASHHSGNNSMMDIGGGGGGGLMGASPRSGLVDLDRHHGDSEPENVRTMALAAFRDQVILPMVDRLDGMPLLFFFTCSGLAILTL